MTEQNKPLDINAIPEKTITKPSSRHISLKERAAKYDGKLIVSAELKWGEAVGRELW